MKNTLKNNKYNLQTPINKIMVWMRDVIGIVFVY
jgi:hypothetical protein